MAQDKLVIDFKNVGIIREAHVEFVDGLNLIVGSSSSGKSTMFRALSSFVNNTFADSQVTSGQGLMAIRIKTKGHDIGYIRDISRASCKACYKIDGETYTKIGRNPLPEVTKILALTPVDVQGESVDINFSSQFSGPFMLAGSSRIFYNIIVNDSSDIAVVNDLYNKDMKDLNQQQKINASIVDKGMLQKVKFESFLSELDTKNLYDMYKDFKQIRTDYTQICSLLFDIDIIDKNIVKLNNSVSKYSEIHSLLDNIDKDIDEFNYLDNLLCEFSNELPVIPELPSVDEFYEYKDLQESIEYLEDITRQEELCISSIKSMELDLASVLEELKLFKVCPFCGSEL